MPSDVTKTVVDAGLVENDTLKELGRWGSPTQQKGVVDMPIDAIPMVLERAMQEESYVQVRETDLEVFHQYMRTRQTGTLHVEFLDGRVEEFDVEFGVTTLKELVIPCTDPNVVYALTEGLTYITVGGTKLVVSDVRELYYGAQQAFLVCRAG
jgi:hypothetical protein